MGIPSRRVFIFGGTADNNGECRAGGFKHQIIGGILSVIRIRPPRTCFGLPKTELKINKNLKIRSGRFFVFKVIFRFDQSTVTGK